VAAVLLAAPAAAQGLPQGCEAPWDLARLRQHLPRVAERIARHEPLTIVAIGSSSTAGTGASSAAASYPSRLEAELRRRLPEEKVVVLNRGIGGETAGDMVARFERDVLAAAPDLVVWQVGTNDVLRDRAVPAEIEIVRGGIERLKGAGIDLVLMDMQYAPAVLVHPAYREMEYGLATLGKEEGVAVFRRFALMRHWRQTEQLDFATMLSPDGLHLNDLSYRCVGQLLADGIVEGAQTPLVVSHARLILP
jgi:acyl-CoA thioesterase I